MPRRPGSMRRIALPSTPIKRERKVRRHHRPGKVSMLVRELGSALDDMFGESEDSNQEEDEDDEDHDFDRQSTRVFNVEEMQQVQMEKEEAEQRKKDQGQISDLYESARASEESAAFQDSEGGEAGESAERDSGTSGGPSSEERERVEWYVAVDEQQVGPLSMNELEERFNNGEFDSETLVWKTGFEDWITIYETPELAYIAAADEQPADMEEQAAPEGEQPEGEPPPSDADFGDEEDEEEAISGLGEDEEPEEDEEQEEDYYAGEEDEEDSFSAASAAAFAGSDVDWKPSAISDLDSLAEEELASLKPPPDPEPEEDGLEGIFGEAEDSGEVEEDSTGEMEEGDSTLIGQIAAEEEDAAKRAEEERQRQEREAEKARQAEEEEALAAQEAARREREEEQREKAAPPPEHVIPARSTIPKWVVWGGFGLGGILVILLGFVAYKLATGPGVPATNQVQPLEGPAKDEVATAGETPEKKPDKTLPKEEKKAEGVPADEKEAPEEAAATPGDEKATEGDGDEKPKAEKDKPEPRKAVVKKGDRGKRRRRAKRGRRKRAERDKPKKKEVASVIKEDPVQPPPEPKKPKRRKSSGGILEFEEDNAAFAKETGSAPVARAEKPKKEVKKELPPLSNADVLQVMRKHLAEFKACNRKQKEKDRSVKGKMVVTFVITNNGRVAKVAVSTKQFKNTFVAGCISKVVKQARFPEFGGPPKKVPFPFTVK